MLKGRNLFHPNEFEKNGKIILKILSVAKTFFY